MAFILRSPNLQTSSRRPISVPFGFKASASSSRLSVRVQNLTGRDVGGKYWQAVEETNFEAIAVSWSKDRAIKKTTLRTRSSSTSKALWTRLRVAADY